MKKFSFIILHYNTLEETSRCIEYIKNLTLFKDSQLIIVDNKSTDDSLSILTEKFKHDNIVFLKSEYNTGFAKGNNLGFSVAKHKYKSEFIIAMNSDVYIKQTNFLNLIEEEYMRSEFFLLGPAIFTINKENQNPVEYIHDTITKVNKTLFFNRLRYFKTYIPIENNLRIKSYFKKNKKNIKIEEYLINVPLHGACIIASPKFIRDHEYLFYPDTFLYGEEDILYYTSNISNEKLVYSRTLEVVHEEDASTKKKFGKKNAIKKRFILHHSSKSLRILKKIMKNS